MDELIDQFNQLPVLPNPQHERQAMLALITQLSLHVTTTLGRHRDTINAARNNRQAMIAKGAEYSMFAVTIATLYMAPLSLLPKIFLFCCSVSARDDAMAFTGLRRHVAHSTTLLTALSVELNNARENLRQALDPEYLQVIPNNNNNNVNHAALFAYSAPMQAYVNFFHHRTSIADILDALNLTEAEEARLEPFCDPILFSVINKPVLLEGQTFDLDALLALRMNDDGMRRNPFTNVDFYPRDLQPNRDFYNKLLAEIELIRKARAVAVIVPSAPALNM
jgi:hypothetical protein